MELWIPITIFAAFMQNARSSLQKYLKGKLSTSGATFSRFLYAAPFAILYVIALHHFGGYPVPSPNLPFVVYAAIGGIAQILATALLVYLFSFRNFAVGTSFSKTETAQAAIFGLLVLGESVSAGALFGIVISLMGVMLISLTRVSLNLRDILRQCTEPPALIGLGSGALFGVSAVAYRAASLALDDGHFLIRAGITLAVATVFQTAVMAMYMRLREPGQMTEVLHNWRVALMVGIAGMLGSVGWFTAMTLQNAAYVRALGQIELIFTFAVSWLFFKERISSSELTGISLITIGILILVLLR